ncbi:MAG: hypothetical protein ACTSWI_00130, partial [Alphaproteobacteria bacterium]
IHLDGLLAWCLAPMQKTRRGLGRGDKPDDIQLPIRRGTLHGRSIWHASALFPIETVESVRFWRKRLRIDRLHLTKGSPNMAIGTYREWNEPMPVVLTRAMVAYGTGNLPRVMQLFTKQLTSLGRKRAYGFGRITKITAKEISDDWSWVKDSCATRWLPDINGARLVRTAPPYWNAIDRVYCCEVGDPYKL